MKTAVRKAALAQAIVDAKDWRETFKREQYQKSGYAVAEFSDVGLRAEIAGSGSIQGFDGSLRMPRDIAIEMMEWLEKRATKELEK